MTNDEIIQAAIEFARHNKNIIAKELTDQKTYPPEESPFSIFMAGSPGAGKTEFSKDFVSSLKVGAEKPIVRIDGDEIRNRLPGYTGDNSFLFQGAISIIVDRIHDYCLERKQTFIFDSTFSKYEKAKKNIERSLDPKKNRFVYIFYVYQRPEIAWLFTQKREQLEGRHIPMSAFIDEFIQARETVVKIWDEFKNTSDGRFGLWIFEKDITAKTVGRVQVKPGSAVDAYMPHRYTKDEIEANIHEIEANFQKRPV